MDWMWVETKREQATSLPRFWPEQWKEGLAIRQNKKSVLQQTLFLSLLKNYHLPKEGFADSSPIITPSVQNCNSTAVMYICLCTLALWRVKPLQYLRVFVPPHHQLLPLPCSPLQGNCSELIVSVLLSSMSLLLLLSKSPIWPPLPSLHGKYSCSMASEWLNPAASSLWPH